MGDSYSPTNVIRDPLTGEVTYDFDGHIHAEGLDLDAGDNASPPDDRKVRWLRLSDGAVVASIYAWEDLGEQILALEAGDSVIVKTTRAIPDNQRILLDTDGNSDFLQKADFHSVRVFHSVDQSIANNTNTILAFDSERHDGAAFHDNATNNSRLTVPAGLAGKYVPFANVLLGAAGASTGLRDAKIKSNGANVIAWDRKPANADGSSVRLVATCAPFHLAVGEYLQVEVFHNQGTAINAIRAADYACEFGMHRVPD